MTRKKNFVENKFGQEICSQKKILNKKGFGPLAVGTWLKNFLAVFILHHQVLDSPKISKFFIKSSFE